MQLPPFQALVDAHARELHRYLVASVGAQEAEDCLQETLLSALRAYPRLSNGENLRAWLYTIASRKATDLRRHARARPSHPLEAARGDEPAVAGHEPGDESLWEAVRSLPERQRAAVVHRFVLDLAYREIGQRMGTSEAAARHNVSAGLRRLRLEVDR